MKLESVPKPPFRVIGLTGGIAAGKSTAARFFADEGIPVLDADRVARELSEPGGRAFDAIVKRFGTADREKVRAIVFSDPTARRDLEAILHPLIREESLRQLTFLARGGIVMYEAALLVETGRYQDLDALVVIEAPRELRKSRLMARNGFSPEEAEKILNAQTSDETRRKVATHVLVNDGTEERLREEVRRVANLLRGG